MSRQRSAGKKRPGLPGVRRPEATARHLAGSTLAHAQETRSKLRQRLLALLPLLLIVIVALAAYANAWPNALVHDDKFYAGSERFEELSNIPRYFTENAWASSGLQEPLYRPLLLVSVTLDARAHGDWVAGYHLSNMAMHALVCILVFGFLLQLLRMTHGESRTNSHVALLTTLIFAVHPVYAEVVNSIFNRSEMLVALGGLAGLLWFLRYMNAKPAIAWAGLGLAYLLALFCRESAITLPGVAAMLLLILAQGNWRARVKQCLPVLWLLLPLAIYVFLRAQALAPVELDGVAAKSRGIRGTPAVGVMLDTLHIPGITRLMHIVGLWYESIKIMVWPSQVSVLHDDISRFARNAGLVLHLALILLAFYQLKRKQYGLVMGLAFFYIALLPASRLIGDLKWMPHLAERYLYFPSIGLAIALAFGLRLLARRFNMIALTSAVVLVLIVLTPMTWARNAVWASDVQLFESEYRNGNRSYTILVWLTAAHLKNSDTQRVVEICDRYVRVQKRVAKLSTHCAVAYSQLGRLAEAERAYLFGTTQKAVRAIAHANLARFYLDQGRWSDAKKHFEMAVKAERLPANRAFRKGHMLVRLYPRDREKLLEAKALFEEALAIQPSFAPARQWLARVNRVLGMR